MPRFFGPRSRSPLSAHLSPPALRPPGRTWLAVGSGAGLLTSVLLAPGCGPDCETLRTCEAAPDMAGAGPGDSGGATGSGGDGSGGDPGTGGTTDTGGAPSGGGSGGDPGRGGKSNGGSGGQGIGGAAGDPGSGGSNEVPPLCEGIDCQQDAVCQIVSNEATCVCEDGFEADGDSCQDIDECTDDPCQENEVCQNEAGSFSCSCAPGFYEDLGECWPDMVLVSAVEENLGGTEGIHDVALSGDGRVAVLTTNAIGLGLDNDQVTDIVYRDLRGGSLQIISQPLDGTPADGETTGASISEDGNRLAFLSRATNLVPGDTNDTWDVFVRTMEAPALVRASVSSSGVQANAGSEGLFLSADGNRVGFASWASNLVPNDTNAERDAFVRDLTQNTTERVSVDSNGTPLDVSCEGPGLSRDGHIAAFSCSSGELFVRNLDTGTTTSICLASDEAASIENACRLAKLSADGRYVLFRSKASDLVPGDTNEESDLFLHDVQAGTTERVNLTADGNQISAMSQSAGMSADARYVLFSTSSPDVVPNDTNGMTDLFLRDRVAQSTTRINVGPDGQQANDETGLASMSADGRFCAFLSDATNFGAATNGVRQAWYKRILP